MTGLDDSIANLAAGNTLLVVLAVALLLGLRHATDPDHLAAVSTLIATEPDDGTRRAGKLGLSWGLGHATTLLVFGLPIVLFGSYLPDGVQHAAEALVGIVIMALAIRLLVRRRHEAKLGRSPLQAYGIGLVHGVGGSAGVGVLLLAGISDRGEAAGALLLFAVATAASMATLSSGFGYALTRGPLLRRTLTLAPALGVVTLAFGAWYAAGSVL
jgi:high-affinity nickel permease